MGVDVAAFNCLLVGVKTARYNEFVLESEIRDALSRLDTSRCQAPGRGYIGQWFAPQAAAELLAFRSLIDDYEHADVLRIVLARAARSARLTTHFDLDFPKEPQIGPYWCFKHKRECRPVERAEHFIRRYGLDTLARIKVFARVRDRAAEAAILHGDARDLALDGRFDAVVTSPPYPGLIDYHEQHRYAYELLGLEDVRELEVGAAAAGTSKAALAAYSHGMIDVLANVRAVLRRGAPVAIVVNDRRDLYPDILDRAGLRLEHRLRRHVNRRTDAGVLELLVAGASARRQKSGESVDDDRAHSADRRAASIAVVLNNAVDDYRKRVERPEADHGRDHRGGAVAGPPHGAECRHTFGTEAFHT